MAVSHETDRRDPLLISAKKAGAILGVSQWSVYRLIEQGNLPARRFGRTIRLRRDLVEHFAIHGELPDSVE